MTSSKSDTFVIICSKFIILEFHSKCSTSTYIVLVVLWTGAFYGGGHSVSTTSDSKRDKKQMERDITRSMFAIRAAEMRHSWNKNKCVCVEHKLQTMTSSFLSL